MHELLDWVYSIAIALVLAIPYCFQNRACLP